MSKNPSATNHVIKKGSCGRLWHSPSLLDVDERARKHLDGVLVAAHHQVGEADIVAGSNDALEHSCDDVDGRLDGIYSLQ